MIWRRFQAFVAAICFGGAAAQATEFGGGVHGPDPLVDRVLGSLETQGAFRWIRSPSPLVPKHGFQGIFDVRLLLTRAVADAGSLPEDLFETFQSCRDRLPEFEGSPKVFEVWNEPDFYFLNESAAEMAAHLKAAWWGVKTRNPEATVLMPSLAFRPGRYALELAANGLASWTDGWNLHYYGWSADFSAFLVHHRVFANAMGCDRPFWLTEIGHLGMSGASAEDPVAQATQAAFHERTMIESWAHGVDRHLLFLLTPFAEARNELGLTDAQGQWRPALDLAVRLARVLPSCRPLFRIRHESLGEDVGLVLDRGDDQWWTVLWSPERPGEMAMPGVRARHSDRGTFALDVAWPRDWNEVRLGLDGATALAPSQVAVLEPTPWRNIHVLGPPAPFRLKDCRWIPWSVSKPAADLASIPARAREELKNLPPRREPSPVVVRWKTSRPAIEDKPSQTVRLPAGEAFADATIELHNFSNQPISGEWNLDAPPGWSVLGPPRPHTWTIPPLAKREVRLRVSPREEPGAKPDVPARFRARWTGADGHTDEASVRWLAETSQRSIWWRWGWRDFIADPRHADAWQVYAQDDEVSSLEVRTVRGANREMAVHWKIPRAAMESDQLRLSLRHVQGRGRPHVQIQMTTAEGETWRYGELTALGKEPWSVNAVLGDFSPAIWSRHRTFLFPPVEKARWISLMFQGVEPGDVIEVRAPSLSH